MRKIGILSDTHNYLSPSIFDYFSECDELWHVGDFGSVRISSELAAFKPLKGVYGNIDGYDLRKIHPLHQRFSCEGLRVWMTHIGGYPTKYPLGIKEALKENPPDLFVCGHSHILKIMRDKELNMLCINPGAAGKEGFHKVQTIVRFQIDAKIISKMEVIELGER